MTRATTGHPTRAFAALIVVVLAWEGSRLPALLDGFFAELTTARAAREARGRPGSMAAARAVLVRRPARRDAVIAVTLVPPSVPVIPPVPAVVPAKARTNLLDAREISSDLRRDEGEAMTCVVFTNLEQAPLALVDDVRLQTTTAAALFATAGYARLAAGDRRAGARLLDAAIVIGSDPRAAAWLRDRDTLRRRWSGSAYVIARRSGDAGLSGTPVLGGGQTGAAIAFTPDPLARRPLSVTLRDFAANTRTGIDGDSAQAAIGLSWRILPGLGVSAERMIPLGSATRGTWSARIAGGAATRRFGIDSTAYAEAGVVGGATYAAAQVRMDRPVTFGHFTLHPGGGAWASIQHDARSVSRLDAGPGVRIDHASLPIEVSVDYRFRLAGNAAPGSGTVVTLSTVF